ncbi:MAG: hypothetical protein AMJ64_14200 [Betaproteobacteria bacterium SG8_39]|nr:MAG: hypothetical protein AMJ64_14200 [Betaproteobacteria bacterium SG8_39]
MSMAMRVWMRGLLLLAMSLTMGSALAADVLLMQNGDRITGKISKIWDGEVYIEPPYADEIKVKLDKVKTIDARRDFEFEMGQEKKFVGQLGVDAQGNQVLVRNGEETPLELSKVEELAEPQTPFEWEARTDVNADSSSGNSDTTNALVQAYGMVRFGDHRHEGKLAYNYQKTEGTVGRNQFDLGYDYNWLFGEHWYFAAAAGYSRDPVRDLDRRVTLGAGLGYQFYDDARRSLKTSVGPALVHEEVAGETSESGAAFWKLDFRHRFYRDKFEYFYRHGYLVYTGGDKNRVFDASTGLRMDIVDDFYTNLQLDFHNESKPALGRKDTDTKVILGIGLKLN